MSAAAKVKLLPFDVEILSGPHLGEKFSFVDTEMITIGRGTENQISLPHDPRVSRVHAEIRQENEIFYIYNRSPKNHVEINGHKEDQYKITQTSKITIGETDLKFFIPQNAKQFKNPLQPIATIPIPVGLQQPMSQAPAPYNSKSPGLVSGQVLRAPPPTVNQGQMPQSNQGQKKRRPSKKLEGINPMLLIGAVVVILGIIFVLPNKPEEQPKLDRPADIIVPVLQDEQRMKESLEMAKAALTKIENQNSREAMARQFFISGMREYLNGNYQRAVSFLSSAYQSDPKLTDAEKFGREAQRKLDRMIDFYFAEGLKYKDSKNYRMCKSSFQTVQWFIRNNLKHPRYIEAKAFFDHCYYKEKEGRL